MYLRSDTTVEYFSFLQFSRLQKMLDVFKDIMRDCSVKSNFFLGPQNTYGVLVY